MSLRPRAVPAAPAPPGDRLHLVLRAGLATDAAGDGRASWMQWAKGGAPEQMVRS